MDLRTEEAVWAVDAVLESPKAAVIIALTHCNCRRLRYARPLMPNKESQMTKNELIAAIAEQTGKTKTDVSAVLASLANVAAKSLKGGSDLTVGGIGKLSAAKREAREARNPSTGATIKVPAKTVVKFKVAKDLADTVA